MSDFMCHRGAGQTLTKPPSESKNRLYPSSAGVPDSVREDTTTVLRTLYSGSPMSTSKKEGGQRVCHQIPMLTDGANGRHKIQWNAPRTSEAKAYWPALLDRAESMEETVEELR